MSSGGKRILFIHGLNPEIRARDLGQEFERYGPIVRCDIPSNKDGRSNIAFIEFEDSRDAQSAYNLLHGQKFMGCLLRIQWAKRPPSELQSRGNNPPPSYDRGYYRAPYPPPPSSFSPLESFSMQQSSYHYPSHSSVGSSSLMPHSHSSSSMRNGSGNNNRSPTILKSPN